MGLFSKKLVRPQLLLDAPPEEMSDSRNARFLSREVVAAQPAGRARTWKLGPVLDQGETQDCTGFTWAGLLMANPVGDLTCRTSVGNQYGHNHTDRARQGLGLAQVAVDRGAIGSYRWATNLAEVRDAVLAVGPVQVSFAWYDSMWSPDRWGRLIVKPSANPSYHSLFVCGYNPAKRLGTFVGPAFKLRNSWGLGWGTYAPRKKGQKPWQQRRRTGEAWITCADFDRLLMTSIAGQVEGNYAQLVCVPMGKTGVRLYDLLQANPNPQQS